MLNIFVSSKSSHHPIFSTLGAPPVLRKAVVERGARRGASRGAKRGVRRGARKRAKIQSKMFLLLRGRGRLPGSNKGQPS